MISLVILLWYYSSGNMFLEFVFYTVAFVVGLCVAFEFYFTKVCRDSKVLGRMPSPPRWPVIGHTIEVFNSRGMLEHIDRRETKTNTFTDAYSNMKGFYIRC